MSMTKRDIVVAISSETHMVQQDVAKVVSDGEEDSDEILQGLPDGGEVIEDDSAVTEDFEDPSDADDGIGEEE